MAEEDEESKTVPVDDKPVANVEEQVNSDLKELESFVADCQQRIASKNELRRLNTTRSTPPEEYFFKLDSSLKKNTSFVKKLRQFTAAQLDGLLTELRGLNLTKYVSEISQALIEAKLKMTDVMPAVTLCSRFHEIYAEFSQTFFEGWQKVLTLKPTESVSNPSKMRVDLRFFAELVISGVFNIKSGLAMLGSILTTLINQDKEDFANINIILSFCKNCGDEFAGLQSKRMIELAQKYDKVIPCSEFLPRDKQSNLRNMLKDYYSGLVRFVKRQHSQLMDVERSNMQMMSTKGEVSDHKREKFEMLQAGFSKLLSSTQVLSDLLDEPMPDFPKPIENDEGRVILEFGDGSVEQDLDPWGDEEVKSFYVDLPDLRVFLPNYAPKIQDITPSEPTMTEDVLDMEIVPEQMQIDDSVVDAIIADEATVQGSEATVTNSSPVPQVENTDVASGNPEEAENKGNSINYHSKQYYDTFVKNLSKCVNRELIDSACIEFLLHMNTKSNRKKISRSLFGVQRTRLDLLPFFGRFVATLNLVATDVANELMKLLNNEFRYHVREKDQIKIESKIKVVRYIGELVKFGLYPKIEALFCLKVLLHDFNHHHIEMVCALLEVCGVYLYNCKDSRLRMNVYLEQMMRLKTASTFDSRHTALIENAFYLIKPPESAKVEQKVRTPLQRYIRHLIFEELNRSNVDKIIKHMRTLDWDNQQTSDYIVRCLTKAYNLRYHLIRCLADLVSGLSSYQDRHMIRVIDGVFEDIRAGLEINAGGSKQLNQRRVAMAKYLGELYNYRLIERANILNTLYLIISLGVTLDPTVVSVMDPPKSLFRLKLICVLLDTCGEYFHGSSRKRLDYFLVFFQQYYWFKKSHPVFNDGQSEKDLFPILTDHQYKDCIKKVRPNLKLFETFDEACEAVLKLREQLIPQIIKGVEDGDGKLSAISEQQHEQDSELEAMSEENDTSDARGDDSEDEVDEDEDDDEENAIREEDDDEEDSDGDDDDAEDGEFLDEDIETELAKRKEIEKSQADMDFESAFERMTIDCYQERIRDNVKPTTKDIPVPMVAKSTKKNYENLQHPPKEEPSSVAFVLMTRGGKSGKQQFKSFNAPVDSQLVTNLKMQEQKVKEENENVKRLTLNITERIEAEDYEESLQRYQAPSRQPKLPKVQKFKHRKGVPDVDSIFQ